MSKTPTPFLTGALAALAIAAIAGIATPASAQAPAASSQRASQPVPANTDATIDPSLLSGIEYEYIGPTRGGRVTAMAGHASHPSTFYFGGTGGGIWRTDDWGESWRNITDGQIPVGSIGTIDVAPSNPDIIYVGTGSAAVRSNVSIGKGMYKSTDGGRTWSFAGLRDVGVIGDMVVHPANADIAYVAAVGNPFGPSPDRGIFRTRDGGRSWDKVLFVSDSTGASDIAMNPLNPDELYAGMWRAERKPWTIISGARAEGGVYKSTNGGNSWTKLSGGLPQQWTGKISVSVAPSNPSRVYALLEAGDGTLDIPGGVHGGVYRSDDSGATWTRTSSQSGLINRPFYYTYIDVDPTDADVVYVNNESFFRSEDGGRTFERRSTPHGDNHGMWINPTDPDIFIQVNDGGANVTRDGGETWSTQHNQSTAEFYQVDVDDRYPYWVYAGQQDNSTIGVPSTGEAARDEAEDWWRTNVGGCETGPAVPQPGTDATVFFSNCKGRFYRYSTLTDQATEYSVGARNMYGHNPKDLKYRFQRVSPIVISPHNPNVVYHTSQYVHRTTDGGRTWETISPDLTANDPRGHVISGSPVTRDITGEEFYSTLYDIDESPVTPGVIWTGSADGPVHVTRNNGANWTDVTPEMPRGGRVQTVEPSPHQPGTAYISVLRYMFDDWTPYIYRTDDYGASWTYLTGPRSGFPQDHPTRVVREDPEREGLLYAGTEYGMFISFDRGTTWQPFQQNLPATVISDAKVYRNDLIIATQGRGFWIIDNLTPLHQMSEAIASRDAHLFTPTEAHRMSGNGAVIDYYLGDVPSAAITLEIVDAGGSVIRSFQSSAPAPAAQAAERPGMPGAESTGRGGFGGGGSQPTARQGLNRFEWDMRAASETGRGSGPAVPPGQYTVRLNAPGTQAVTTSLTVGVDPRLLADGITAADLRAQYDLAKQVAQLAADAAQLEDDIGAARTRLEAANNSAALRRLEAIESQVVTARTAYPQPMLVSQIGFLNGIVSRGDNRPSRDAFERYAELRALTDQLRRELEALR